MNFKKPCCTYQQGFLFYAKRKQGFKLNCTFEKETENMSELIVNKVAESGILSFDIEAYYPKEEIKIFDLKPYLFMELILKEKDFRAALQTTDWEQYSNKLVGIVCTADAIIPMWAYMLITSYLQPVAKDVFLGDEKKIVETILVKQLEQVNAAEFADKRVVIKGCGEVPIPEAAYITITNKLRPVAKSIMYGEPCSTVPIYKKK